MLLESFEFDLPVQTLHLIFGAVLGLIFGIAAQISRFCLRRSVAGEAGPDARAASPWLMALAVAIGGYFIAGQFGLVALDGHRFLSGNLPVLAIVLGGLIFGAGMVLTRGCVSRLTVLSATGNLRAVTVLLVFAVVAHAAIKGVLAPLRVALGTPQLETPITSLSEIPGLAPTLAVMLVLGALFLARRFGASWRDVALGAVIGLVAVGGWVTTSALLFDEFDPLPVQSVAFTLPWSDTLFWVIASTAIPAGFGTGLIGGVLVGSFASAAMRGDLKLQSFESPSQTLRYVAGGAMMGLGGVLAGGCTVGAGLSGSATLSIAALLALASIAAGGFATRQLLEGRGVTAPA